MPSPFLSNKNQKKICTLIIAWQGKLTWQALTKSIVHDLGLEVTRQTLAKYHAIKNEYVIKKQELRGVPVVNRTPVSGSAANLINTNNALKAENTLLQTTVNKQLHFIQNMLDNARTMNINVDDLIESKE